MASDLFHEFSGYPTLLSRLAGHKNAVQSLRVSYGIRKEQYFLHFTPQQPRSDKVVVYLHGGGWDRGDPSALSFIGSCFAQNGYHCISIGYRKTPQYRFPAQIEDVCTGYTTALSYLEMLGVHPGRVAVVGSSAGAQLGALLCYDRAVQQEHAIDPGAFCGFAGLGGPYRFNCDDAPLYLRHQSKKLLSPGQDPLPAQPYYRLTPQSRIPMLIIHSRRDGVVGWSCAVDLFARAKELKIPAQLYIVRSHGDSHSAYTAGIFLERRDECPTLAHLLDWLDAL